MSGNFGEFAISSVIDGIASTLNKNSYPSGAPSWFSPLNGGHFMGGNAPVRLALFDSAFSMPQPGEIWQLCRSVQSPLPLSDTEQRSQYPDAVQRFLAGKTPPRYVMVVTEPEPPNAEWQTVSVMMLSVKTEYISAVDLVIPAELSGVGHDLLAETWHIQRGLVCNLQPVGGHRLSRHLYDLLLSVGDRHYNLIDHAPTQEELQSAGLTVGSRAASDERIQQFHQQEREWGRVLNLPVEAYRTFVKSMQLTSRVLEEALLTACEMTLNPVEQDQPDVGAVDLAIAQEPTHLSPWFEQQFSHDWKAIALNRTVSASEPTELDVIETLIHQFNTGANAEKRHQIIHSLGNLNTTHPAVIEALAQLVQTTDDTKTLWIAVESLRKLMPDHPSAGVQRIKQIGLSSDQGNHSVALAIAITRPADRVAILLRLVPDNSELTLPTDLTLSLQEPRGNIVRTIAQPSKDHLQIAFSGVAGETFRVSLTLGDASFIESFVI